PAVSSCRCAARLVPLAFPTRRSSDLFLSSILHFGFQILFGPLKITFENIPDLIDFVKVFLRGYQSFTRTFAIFNMVLEADFKFLGFNVFGCQGQLTGTYMVQSTKHFK